MKHLVASTFEFMKAAGPALSMMAIAPGRGPGAIDREGVW